jgi:hypothetical protein
MKTFNMEMLHKDWNFSDARPDRAFNRQLPVAAMERAQRIVREHSEWEMTFTVDEYPYHIRVKLTDPQGTEHKLFGECVVGEGYTMCSSDVIQREIKKLVSPIDKGAWTPS